MKKFKAWLCAHGMHWRVRFYEAYGYYFRRCKWCGDITRTFVDDHDDFGGSGGFKSA